MTRGVRRDGQPRRRSAPKPEKKRAVLVRMPEPMVAALDGFAKNGYRSRSAEILLRLEYTLHVDHAEMLSHRRAKATDGAGEGHA